MDGVLTTAACALGLLLAAVLLQGRRAVFWFAFALPFVPIEYVDRYHLDLPAALKWSPLFGIVFAGAAAFLLLPEVRTRVPRRVVATVAALVGLAALSMVANGTAVAAFVVAQKGWIVAAAAAFALTAGYGLYRREDLYAGLVRAGLLSSVVSAFQRVVVVPTVSGPDAADRVTGLFSVGYLQVYFHLFCIGVVLAYELHGRRLLRAPTWLVLLVLVGSLAVGNEKASLPYLVALVGFVLVRCGVRETARRHGALLAGALVLPALLLVGYSAVNDEPDAETQATYREQMLDPGYLTRYFFGDESTQLTSGGELRRGAAVLFVWNRIADSPLQVALGLGPGETSESRIPGASGGLAERYPGYHVSRVALAMILGDGGLLGLVLYGLFLAAVWFAREPGEPPEHARVREVLVFLVVGFAPYANLTNEAIHCLLLAAVLYPLLRQGER